jgi:hypothetical protein
MTLHIGSQIARGELINDRRKSLFGWLDFGGDWGVRIGLTGGFSGDLAGKHIRFEASRPTTNDDCPREALDDLANEQIGVTGQMCLRYRDDGTAVLALEWFSQNGHVMAEIIDPIIAYGPAEEPPSDATAADDLLMSEIEPAGDPFQLFAPELEAEWAASSRDDEKLPESLELEQPESGTTSESFDLDHVGSEPPSELRQERPWDEVIPGLDPETKRMYEEWDAITDGTQDVPFDQLFDPPLRLKRPADITSEDEAAGELHTLLARLALHCVAVHICDHYTALDTYRLLLEDLLPEQGIYPNLKPTGFVRHYDTSESCDACDAEFEVRWKAERGE